MSKPTICLDFDGVIHGYESGWQGVATIPDAPVPGAIEFILKALRDGYAVSVLSSRSSSWRGRRAMKAWLQHWGGACFLDAILPIVTDSRLYRLWCEAGFSPVVGGPDEEADRAGRFLVRQVSWPKTKPPAVVTIDDRGWRFTGVFPDPAEAANVKPWNK